MMKLLCLVLLLGSVLTASQRIARGRRSATINFYFDGILSGARVPGQPEQPPAATTTPPITPPSTTTTTTQMTSATPPPASTTAGQTTTGGSGETTTNSGETTTGGSGETTTGGSGETTTGGSGETTTGGSGETTTGGSGETTSNNGETTTNNGETTTNNGETTTGGPVDPNATTTTGPVIPCRLSGCHTEGQCSAGFCVNSDPVSCSPSPDECFASLCIPGVDECRSVARCPERSCNIMSCNGGVCSYTPMEDGTACDDGDSCTANDECASGVCVGETVALGTVCVDTACEQRVCAELIPGFGQVTCSRVVNRTTCVPSQRCVTSTCNAITGVCEESPIVCDRGDGCSIGSCNNETGACEYTPVDGSNTLPPTTTASTTEAAPATTAGNTTDAVTTTGVPETTTEAANTTVAADTTTAAEATSSEAAATTSTVEGSTTTRSQTCQNDMCSTQGSCSGLECAGSVPIVCPQGSNRCIITSCNPATGACDVETSVCPERTCEVMSCNNGTCSYTQAEDGSSCDDGNACTTNDECTGGVCRGEDVAIGTVCLDTPCLRKTCSELVPGLGNIGCNTVDREITCIPSGNCVDSTCNINTGGCTETPKVCEAPANGCAAASCDELTGCVFTPFFPTTTSADPTTTSADPTTTTPTTQPTTTADPTTAESTTTPQ